MDRQRDRQTDGQTDRQTVPASMLTTESRIFSTLCTGLHRETDRQTDRGTDIQTDRWTDRDTDRWTDRQTVPASMLTTERRIFSTLCTGLHRSELDS